MELKLARIFDYQKFAGTAHLGAVIDRTHAELAQGRALTDAEADIWAAGEATPKHFDLSEQNHDGTEL